MTARELDRFWKHIEISPTGCWIWTGKKYPNGYAEFWRKKAPCIYRRTSAHIVSYEHFVGPVPKGMILDHTCHNSDQSCAGGKTCPHRACVNWQHLEPVTHIQNCQRGVRPRRTHCPQGHPYAGGNLHISLRNGQVHRQCVECRERHQRNWNQQRRELRKLLSAEI
jgi:hypothetical protein